MAATRYRITVTTHTGEKKAPNIVEGKGALFDALVRLGVSQVDARRSVADRAQEAVGFERVRVRWVALGWKIDDRGGSTADVLKRVAARDKSTKTPQVFLHAPDGAAEYKAGVGMPPRRASYWCDGPRKDTVWAVDVEERRFVLLAGDPAPSTAKSRPEPFVLGPARRAGPDPAAHSPTPRTRRDSDARSNRPGRASIHAHR